MQSNCIGGTLLALNLRTQKLLPELVMPLSYGATISPRSCRSSRPEEFIRSGENGVNIFNIDEYRPRIALSTIVLRFTHDRRVSDTLL